MREATAARSIFACLGVPILGRQSRRWLVAVALALALTSRASAQNYVFENGLFGGRITDAEWKSLPVYCIDTQGFKYGRDGSPNSAKWVALLGDMFWNLHHYCLGIIEFNRAQRRMYAPLDRRGLAESAVADFHYVIDHMPERYVLAPEIYTYAGRAHLLLDQVGQADAAFQAARSAKPDYWPAYSWWATYLSDHGKARDALNVVDMGLQKDPSSRTLLAMKRELQDKLRR